MSKLWTAMQSHFRPTAAHYRRRWCWIEATAARAQPLAPARTGLATSVRLPSTMPMIERIEPPIAVQFEHDHGPRQRPGGRGHQRRASPAR